MPVRANIDGQFLWRSALIPLFLLGFALWFLYDGTITYPKQRERALVYQELEEEDRIDEWKEIAKKNGWPTKDPGKPKGDLDIKFQLVLAAVAAVPGLITLFFFLRARGRWIEANETGIRTSWGRQLEFGDIVSLNKKKWKSKGIAKITYGRNGRKSRVVLDDWKYEAEPTRAILREIESHLDLSQIVGGPPEPEPQEEEQEGDAAEVNEAG